MTNALKDRGGATTARTAYLAVHASAFRLLRPVLRGSVEVLTVANLILILIPVLLFIAFAILTVVGCASNQPIPPTTIFKLLPISDILNRSEPHFPFIIITLALLWTMLSWIGHPDIQISKLIRRREIRAIRLWQRFGLITVAGTLSLFVVAGAWSGHVERRDLPYMNIAGLVPHSDAMGYFVGARNFLLGGVIDDWNLRRPLATFFRAVTVAAGDYTYVGTILVQIAAVSFALYTATTFVVKWRGYAAGAAFFGMSFIMTRPFLPSTMTESLGFFCAFLSLPLLIGGLLRRSPKYFSLGFLLLTAGIFIRMGAMFVIPLVPIWAIFFFGENFRSRVASTTLICLSAALVVLANYAIISFFGTPSAQLGSTFSWVACGMSVNGLWNDCARIYANELKALQSEAAQANFLYHIAWQNVLADPWALVHSMGRGVLRFLTDVPSMPLIWYTWEPPPPLLLPSLYAIAALGWIMHFRRGISLYATAFVVLVCAGVLASTPFTYFEDARRVFGPIYPYWAVIIACGIAGPATVHLPIGCFQLSAVRVTAASSALCLLVLSVVVIAHARHPEYREWVAHPGTVAPDERIISGHEFATGFAVLEDDAAPLQDVPSLGITKFREFLRAANIDPSQSGYPLPTIPFAMINTREWIGGTYAAYFAPLDVLRDRSVRRWRVKTEVANPVQGWVHIVDAKPVP